MDGLAKGYRGKKGSEAVAQVIGTMFASRDFAHRAHLKTSSYSTHKALDDFYIGVVGKADAIAEAAQGMFGKLDIPVVTLKDDINEPANGLESQLEMIVGYGKGCEESMLLNLLDEVKVCYRTTLYKLRELN